MLPLWGHQWANGEEGPRSEALHFDRTPLEIPQSSESEEQDISRQNRETDGAAGAFEQCISSSTRIDHTRNLAEC